MEDPNDSSEEVLAVTEIQWKRVNAKICDVGRPITLWVVLSYQDPKIKG